MKAPRRILGFTVLLAALLTAACGGRDEEAAGGVDAETMSAGASGETLYLVCAGCHPIEGGAPHGVGPNLHGILDAPAASRPGYTYSEALVASGLTWTPGLLRGFVLNAEAMVPGTWMAYRDVLTTDELDRLMEYIMAASSRPTPSPAADR